MSTRLARIKQIVESSSRAVWGAFGAEAARTGEVPAHDAIQDMVAIPASDALLDLHELLPLEESEVYYLIRVLLAAGPEAIAGSADIMAKALGQAVVMTRRGP